MENELQKVKTAKKRQESSKDMEYRNKRALTGWAILQLTLALAYLMEYIQGNRTLTYTLVYESIVLVPLILGVAVLLKKRDWRLFKYFASITFLVLYAFTLFTTVSNLAFVYTLAMMCVLIAYNSRWLIIMHSSISITIVVVALWRTRAGQLTVGDIAIQVLSVLLCEILACQAIRAIDNVNARHMEEIEKTAEKNKAMLETILKVSEGLAGSSESLRDEVKNLSESSVKASASMQNISDGTKSTADSIQEQSVMTENIQTLVESIQEEQKLMVDSSTDAEESVKEGLGCIEDLNDSAGKSRETFMNASAELADLLKYLSQVKDIAVIIKGIAYSTNLLALNASIESARAGNAGKGFAVVAGEIGDLANKTKESTQKIEELISELEKKSALVDECFGSLTQISEDQNGIILTTDDVFKKIKNAVDVVHNSVASQDESIRKLAESNNSIVSSISTISASSEEVTANTDITRELIAGNKDDAVAIEELIEKLHTDISQLNSLNA